MSVLKYRSRWLYNNVKNHAWYLYTLYTVVAQRFNSFFFFGLTNVTSNNI